MNSIRAASLLALASLATALAVPSAAKAAIFTVGGQQYDVTTFTGSYNDNSSLFNTASAGGAMPWWGNSSLAEQFASAVGTALGAPNGNGSLGPFFAEYIEDPFGMAGYVAMSGFVGPFPQGTQIIESFDNVTYARATLIPPSATPAPGPLPILGAASAFGMSRRLRRRITSQAFKL